MRTLALLLLLPAAAAAQGTAADYARAAGLREKTAAAVRNGKLEPRWAADGKSVVYSVENASGVRRNAVVDFATGTRRILSNDELPPPYTKDAEPAAGPRTRRFGSSNRSPDGKTDTVVKDHNLWLKDVKAGTETQLTKDGTAADGYTGRVFWSPDSAKLVAIRTKAGGDRKVTLVESSPAGKNPQPKTSTYFYLKPGDDIPLPKPHLFDIAAKKEIPVADTLFPNPWDVSFEHWSPDGKRFYFLYNQRGHGVIRVIAIDAATGAATAIVNEECNTFFDYAGKLYLRYLDAANELVWMSERSGWNHLYRIDALTGKVKNAITSGEWVVRGVDRFDEAAGVLRLRVMGKYADQDPYHVHFATVKLDGSSFTPLTRGDGTHELTWAPDGKHYVDTYSRVDLAPVYELRRADGSLVCELDRADTSRLWKDGWPPPERFTAKARDGKTDIWGVIVRPTNFDPAKKYPVIESIYAGPHDHHVPKRFRPMLYEQQMAELGFIVVKIDGMGTNWRSKAFHDVCWKNLGDSGFPDRVKWIKEAAAKHPEMDLPRGVGIYGGSAGGQSTMRGMTEYPDFYTVGVADCGCHDNRMDKIWWNELWMSWPVGPHYAAQSNVTNAHKLRGKLLLIVGELDRNVDPASTLQVANALVKANRDFEMLLVPGGGHGIGESPYGSRRRADFFVRNLLGVEPRR